MKPIFKRAVIAGVGLIGGSLALAGKKRGIFETVVGLGRRESTLLQAKELGIVDEITIDPIVAAQSADLVFAATPPGSIASLCEEIAPHLPEGCVITDGGSVKEKIVARLDEKLPTHVRFIGGHPVAGTERSGPAAAFDTLYDGRYTVLTPTSKTDDKAIGQVTGMWEGVGARVVTLSPVEHDAAMAVISHLPHLAAYALVETLCEADDEGSIKRFVAGGFKDITRIAASDPGMWREIFAMNKGNLLDSIGRFEAWMDRFKKAIEKGDFDTVQKLLEKAQTSRKDIP
ncbi:Prephenate dehydrogenase [hydrothermal vent metagenome]|uniref:Prephenate dehydrogenase n=1 Tax=hydrothermal vent metagenome TaxID=652676 RepID=A0A3B1BJE0_9ZZZZ